MMAIRGHHCGGHGCGCGGHSHDHGMYNKTNIIYRCRSLFIYVTCSVMIVMEAVEEAVEVVAEVVAEEAAEDIIPPFLRCT